MLVIRDIYVDVEMLDPSEQQELTTWVRSVVGAVVDYVRPYLVISCSTGPNLLHLSLVLHDICHKPVMEQAKHSRSDLDATAQVPLVVDLEGQAPWPDWLNDEDRFQESLGARRRHTGG